MKQNIAQALGDGASTLAVASGMGTAVNAHYGWFEFVNANAGGIGVLTSAFFGFVGLFFYYITYKKTTLARDNKISLEVHAIKLDDHIQETKTQFNSLSSGIDSIIKRLD